MKCEWEEPSAEWWCLLCKHPFFEEVDALVACGTLKEKNKCPKKCAGVCWRPRHPREPHVTKGVRVIKGCIHTSQ